MTGTIGVENPTGTVATSVSGQPQHSLSGDREAWATMMWSTPSTGAEFSTTWQSPPSVSKKEVSSHWATRSSRAPSPIWVRRLSADSISCTRSTEERPRWTPSPDLPSPPRRRDLRLYPLHALACGNRWFGAPDRGLCRKHQRQLRPISGPATIPRRDRSTRRRTHGDSKTFCSRSSRARGADGARMALWSEIRFIADHGPRVVAVDVHDGDGMEFPEDIRNTFGVTAYPNGMVDRTVFDGEAEGAPLPRQLGNQRDRTAQRLHSAQRRRHELLQSDHPAGRCDHRHRLHRLRERRSALCLHVGGGQPLRIGIGLGPDELSTMEQLDIPYFLAGDPILGYNHRHVLSDISSAVGNPWAIPTPVAPGDTASESFTFILPATVDATQVTVVGFVAKYGAGVGQKSIYNVQQAPLGETREVPLFASSFQLRIDHGLDHHNPVAGILLTGSSATFSRYGTAIQDTGIGSLGRCRCPQFGSHPRGIRSRRGGGDRRESRSFPCGATGSGPMGRRSRHPRVGAGSPTSEFAQAVVHLQKGRAATWEGVGEAWRRLIARRPSSPRRRQRPRNQIGGQTAVRRTRSVGRRSSPTGRGPGRVLASRGRIRARLPVIPPIEVVTGDDRFELELRRRSVLGRWLSTLAPECSSTTSMRSLPPTPSSIPVADSGSSVWRPSVVGRGRRRCSPMSTTGPLIAPRQARPIWDSPIAARSCGGTRRWILRRRGAAISSC